MKRICLLLCLILFLVACGTKNEEKIGDAENTAPQEVPGGITAQIISFDPIDSLKEADLIAEITIGKKIKEVDEQPIPYTLFQASINKVVKGNGDLQEIEIVQQGNSEWAFNDNEFFEEGEQYTLFLKKYSDGKDQYWIKGEETGMFLIKDADTIIKLAEPIEAFDHLVDTSSEHKGKKFKNKDGSQILNKQKFDALLEKEVKGE